MQKRRANRVKRPLFKDKSDDRKKHILLLMVIASCISLLVLLLIFDNTRVKINNVTISVSGLPKEFEGFTIVLLSDLNGKRFGEKQQTLLRAIHSQKCNAVVMTGDMVGESGDPEPFFELLDGLTDRKVFFITGDADPDPIQPHLKEGMEYTGIESIEPRAEYIMGAINRGAIYLDVPYVMAVGDKKVVFAYEFQLSFDVDAAIADLQNQVESYSASEETADKQAIRAYRLSNMISLKEKRDTIKSDDLRVILHHYPLSETLMKGFKTANENGGRTVLYLSGHYNGGQWRFPFYGALHVPMEEASFGGWFPNQKNVMGLVEVDGINQYISAGLGVSKTSPFPFFRLFNTPEISVIQLTGFFEK